MAICQKCGAEVSGAFCPKCGTPAPNNQPPQNQQWNGAQNQQWNGAQNQQWNGVPNQQWNGPQPYPYNGPVPGKGFSIAALVLGIVSCVLAWFSMINIIALATGVVGLIFAIKGRKAAAEVNAPSGLGTAGLVLSIIGLTLAAIGFFSCTLCVVCAAGSVSGLGAFM